MARKALKNKARSKPKFKVRGYNRCPICGPAQGLFKKGSVFAGFVSEAWL